MRDTGVISTAHVSLSLWHAASPAIHAPSESPSSDTRGHPCSNNHFTTALISASA